MSHMLMENDTMFSANRIKPWHYEMTKDKVRLIQEAPNSHDALVAAGLDWEVFQSSTFMDNGLLIPGFKTNYRVLHDGTIIPLGIVSDRYKIVQNTDAFEFTDNLIGGDVRYETAGSLCNGKRVWVLAKLPSTKVAGDETETYVAFTNTHDGTGAVKAIVTPIRVVCNNTLSLALNTAQRSWSMRHLGDVQGKLEDARNVLELTEIYMEQLDKQAERWANVTIDEEKTMEALNMLFPVKEDDTDRKKRNVQEAKDNFIACYLAPDIAKFYGTAWGFINATSDYVTHATPKRLTANWEENRWGKIMDGSTILDQAVNLFATAV